MFMHPKDFWQRGMWRLIEKICPNFKTQLQERTIPSPPPNTPEPLLSRWRILHDNCTMSIPLNQPLAKGQLCWDPLKGLCVAETVFDDKSATLRPVSFREDGSFSPIPNSNTFHTDEVHPTTAVLNSKGKWRSRRIISYGIPSPHFFRLKNEKSYLNLPSLHFSMAMAYSKFFRYKIPPHTPYKPSKLSR
jgi:hypothetical protein